MKIFKRLLILQWHYIEHEYIELGNVNFLTGKNGSGKSTIIDAMQVVLLGDTRGAFFNKAANEKSQRTLLSYAKGELSDDEEAGFKYLRNDDFTSLIALEVYDDAKKKSFTIGVQIEVHSDNSSNNRFFIYDGKIPSNHFISKDLVMNISELKAYALKEGVRLEQPTSMKAYQELLLARLGNVNRKYFSLFKKAVPFSPITDIKGFITEFICDTEKKVDIENMQNNIRYYERMKLEAEDVEKRVASLEKIQEAYQGFTRYKKLAYLQGYLVKEGEHQLALEAVKKTEERIEHGVKSIESSMLQKRKEEERLEILRKESDSVNDALIRSDVYRQEKDIKEQIEKYSKLCMDITEDRKRIVNALRQRCLSWSHIAQETPGQIQSDAMAEIVDGLGQIQIDLTEENYQEIYADHLKALNHKMTESVRSYDRKRYEADQRRMGLKGEINSTENAIIKLKKGKKNVEQMVERLQDILGKQLQAIHGREVPVYMVCDRMEIRDPQWHDAVEAYLHLQKFYLYVEPKYFLDALKIYEQFKESNRIYDVGLIDMEKIMEQGRKAKSGSLAEEIETDDPYVRRYMDYLLGKVMKVTDVEELRQHRTSITSTCMLYKNYVARQLNPMRYQVPYIGKEAVKHQLQIKASELSTLKADYEEVEKSLAHLTSLCDLRRFDEHLLDEWSRRKEAIILLPEYEHQKYEWEDKLRGLDRTNVIELNDRLELLKKQISDKGNLLIKISTDIKVSEDALTKDKYEILPGEKSRLADQVKALETGYDAIWIMETGMPKYQAEYTRLGSNIVLVRNFKRAGAGTEDLREKAWNETIGLRSAYIRDFQGTFDPLAVTNREYDQLLDRLQETDLPAYQGKIKEAIDVAQQEFKDDFLSKLKHNIDTVNEQIRELNDALKNMSFGTDDYMFKVTPNSYYRKYYDMITDPNLLDGFNIFSFEFQEKYRDVIDELFKKIVDIGEGAISADERAEIEQNIAKYTDYRTYLDFDLVVTDGRGNRSHLSKMISKKSGGETQTPFYISVLASFFRVYRMNIKSKDTSRLIIFDEAFSKMDHERIEVCLRLLKELGFQALISAPSEKIANITPLVDKTLCVIRTQTSTVVKAFTKEELIQ